MKKTYLLLFLFYFGLGFCAYSQVAKGRINTYIDKDQNQSSANGYFIFDFNNYEIRMTNKDGKQLIYRKIKVVENATKYSDSKEYKFSSTTGDIIILKMYDDKEVMLVTILDASNTLYGYICDIIQRY